LSRGFIVAVVAAMLVATALIVPVPLFYLLVPGPVQDVGRRLEVSGARTYSSEGRLYLTTVGVDVSVTVAEMVRAGFDATTVVVTAAQVTGGRSLDQLERAQRTEMVQSKQHARAVALGAAGFGRPTGMGARVVATARGSPAEGVLHKGDVITAVDGSRVATSCDVGRAVDAADVGDRLIVSVRRRGRAQRVLLETARDPRNAGAAHLGVGLADVRYRFDPEVEVTFPTGRVAGPSAGLMFALALYDRLTPADLTSARDIAGTGTLDCAGGVGPIGGVGQKVVAAEVQGADVFLAPVGNVAAARAASTEIEIVGVSTFDDARRYLE
jgi:PDZ domain-containing protein